jgi:hypothetical protein
MLANPSPKLLLPCLQPPQHEQQQSSGHHGQQVTNQTSGQSVQAKNVNTRITGMDDMFLAFAMVQQIMTGLLGAATEKGKVGDMTKAVFRLLKTNATNSS